MFPKFGSKSINRLLNTIALTLAVWSSPKSKDEAALKSRAQSFRDFING